MMRRIFLVLLITVVICFFTSECFAYLSYPNDSFGGFWQGLWHGIISFVTLPLSVWFPSNIHVYNSSNNGFTYNVGFFIPAILECEASIPFIQLVDVMIGCIVLDFKWARQPERKADVFKGKVCDFLKGKLGLQSLSGNFTKHEPNYFSVWEFNPKQK